MKTVIDENLNQDSPLFLLSTNCVDLQLAIVREQIARDWQFRLTVQAGEFWCIRCRKPFELLSFPSGESYPSADFMVCKCPHFSP